MLASMTARQTSAGKRQTSAADSLFESLQRVLAPEFQQPGRIAVFDADGTLWRRDATETLMRALEDIGVIGPPAGSPCLDAHLESLYQQSYVRACEFCAQVFAGHRLVDVLRWSEMSFQRQLEPSMVTLTSKLVRWLHSLNAEVHVVSASPWWCILPGTRRLGIPDSRVHGLDVEMESGRLTSKLIGRIQSGEGKAQTVRELPSLPVFVAGNTVDDAAMMRLSSCTALAVEPMRLADDLRDLYELAEAHGWYVLEPGERAQN